jgi:hypothetical protein
MPIERRTSRSQTTTLIVSVVALAIAVILVIGVLRAATHHSHDTVIAPNATFDAGPVKDLLAEIRRDGPTLYPDVAGGGQIRPIYVSHTGATDKTGWQVIDGRVKGAKTDCFLKWKPSRNLFATSCDDQTFPPGGGSQHHYKWKIIGGDLLIQLNTKA